MYTLDEIQRGFLAALLHGGDPSLAGAIREDGLSAAERVAIYRNNAVTSLGAALAAVYPVIERLVDRDYFRQAATAYIRQHPSRSGNLHEFGKDFPAFVARLPEMGKLPYSHDVARIEWARHHAFHAPHEPPFPLERLVSVPSEDHGQLRFTLSGSATLIASQFPVVAIWEANQTDLERPETVDLAAGAESAAVWRNGGEALVRRLGAGDHALLGALASDRTLAAAIDSAREIEPDIDIASCLRAHVAAGTVNNFKR